MFLEFHGETGNYLYSWLNFQKEIAGKITENFFSGSLPYKIKFYYRLVDLEF